MSFKSCVRDTRTPRCKTWDYERPTAEQHSICSTHIQWKENTTGSLWDSNGQYPAAMSKVNNVTHPWPLTGVFFCCLWESVLLILIPDLPQDKRRRVRRVVRQNGCRVWGVYLTLKLKHPEQRRKQRLNLKWQIISPILVTWQIHRKRVGWGNVTNVCVDVYVCV